MQKKQLLCFLTALLLLLSGAGFATTRIGGMGYPIVPLSGPLRIYVDSVKVAPQKDKYEGYVREAMDQWAAALDNRLSYKITYSVLQADITVHLAPDWQIQFKDDNRIGEAHTKSTTVVRHAYCETKHADPVAREIIIHELGHMLGLGHSSQPADIMYTNVTRFNISGKLTARDIAAIRYAYHLPGGAPY